MNDYVIRLTMLAPSAKMPAQRLDAVFDLLDSQGLAEDVSDIDASGRFSLWLRILAPSPQQALSKAIDAVEGASLMVEDAALGSIIGVDIQLEEGVETATPAVAAG